jgi:hypothetical protein
MTARQPQISRRPDPQCRLSANRPIIGVALAIEVRLAFRDGPLPVPGAGMPEYKSIA